jgi:hypothetical protein
MNGIDDRINFHAPGRRIGRVLCFAGKKNGWVLQGKRKNAAFIAFIRELFAKAVIEGGQSAA